MKDRTSNSIGAWNWKDIDWKTVNLKVTKLRYRIFRAANNARNGTGKWKTVRSLMKLLHRSYCALLLAIKKVTYLNQGKNTPGVDNMTVSDRNKFMKTWSWSDVEFLPARRVYIPKSNGKLRPLGIPTINDRIAQAILLLSYEAVFEGTFEGCSYGFRPGRSCHDAMQNVFLSTGKNSINKWVLEADIKGAFDNISHEFILDTIKFLPGSELIRNWLKAGYIEDNTFHRTNHGTPQGGIISPLLANIALDGLQKLLEKETCVTYTVYENNGRAVNQKRTNPKYKFIRYADDFVILSPEKEYLEEVMPIVIQWLAHRGLLLNDEKTKITKISDGFDFLGFHFQQYEKDFLTKGSKRYNRRKNKGKSKQSPKSILPGGTYYGMIATPQKEKVKDILDDIRTFLKGQANILTFNTVLKMVNTKLRGWANYYRYVCSKKTFTYIHHMVWNLIGRFLKRRHPKKSWKWIAKNYYCKKEGNNYTFHSSTETRGRKESITYLINIAKDVPIFRFTNVKGENSPLDPELKNYWEKRNATNAKKRFAKGSKYQNVFNNQNGICPVCGKPIEAGELWDVHHKIPVKDGGDDTVKNLVFLHKECHKAKHRELHYS